MSSPRCAHTQIYTLIYGMRCMQHGFLMACPCLSVCETSLFAALLSCSVEQPVHCHLFSFLLYILKPHWPHTLTRMQSSEGCQIFSLINWLHFILFNTATSLAFLECPSPHTCRKVCVSAPPSPYFQTLTFDDLMNCSETPAGCTAQQNPV